MRQDSVLNIPHLKIICDSSTKPQAVTSNRSTLTTVIATGNALGNYVPQYYVFKRKRWNPDFQSRNGWRDVRNWLVQQSGVPELLDKILH